MKKILATFLALVMVLSSLCLPAVADSANTSAITLEPSDFTTADTGDHDENGNTTELLVTAKVTKAMNEAVAAGTAAGAYKMPEFVLTDDVVIEVTEANKTTVFPLIPVEFQGVLDGDNHTISFTYAEGVVADLSANHKGVLFNKIGGWDKTFDSTRETIPAEVKNLTIDGAKFTSSGDLGAQHGVIASGTTATVKITNVDIINTEISKTASINRNIGGYIGNVANSVTFTNCTFGGTIAVVEDNTFAAAVGGFIGRSNGAGTASFTGCTVLAGSELSGYTYAGGFVGQVTTASGTVKFTGANVMNATVSANENAGGVIGAISKARTGDTAVQITDMLVTGSVTATNDKSGHAGGVIGFLNSAYTAATTHGKKDISIEGVTVTGDVTSPYRAGGILGDSTTAYTTVLISNCVNTGDVEATTNAAGGIVGGHGTGANNTFTIQGCVNTGDVTSGAYRAAGIAAHIGGTPNTVAISDCVNFGKIACTVQEATAATQNAATINCFITAGTVTNCLNFGTRSGWKAVIEDETTTYVADTDSLMSTHGTVENCVDHAATAGVTGELLALTEGGKAQMRYSNDVTDAGIRFMVDTNSTWLTAFETAGFNYTLGSLMATKETVDAAGMLTKEALTLTGKKYSDVNTGAVVKNNQYAVAINNIGQTNYATEFQCAGYITLTKGDLTFTIYTEASEARSVAYIADAILDANTETDAITKYGDTLRIFQAALATE